MSIPSAPLIVVIRRRFFGSVRRLPCGRWQARYPGPDGQIVPAPITFPTKGDAARYLAGMEVDQARGSWLDPRARQITLDTWATDWLIRPGKRRYTLVRGRLALAKYIPSLGHWTLRPLTPALIGIFVPEEADKVAPATAARSEVGGRLEDARGATPQHDGRWMTRLFGDCGSRRRTGWPTLTWADPFQPRSLHSYSSVGSTGSRVPKLSGSSTSR